MRGLTVAVTLQYVGEMKIYFGFTMAGDRSAIEAAKRIVQLLEAAGHAVLTRHLVEEGAREADRLITPKEVFSRDMKWLEECDLFVAEVSGSSFGLGFETGYLLGSSTKKTLLFYRRDMAARISLLITGNSHPNCTLLPYSDVQEVEKFITNEFCPKEEAAIFISE